MSHTYTDSSKFDANINVANKLECLPNVDGSLYGKISGKLFAEPFLKFLFVILQDCENTAANSLIIWPSGPYYNSTRESESGWQELK